MKTYIAPEKEINGSRKWYVVDAKDQILGRLASRIAQIIRGKHKPIFSRHQDTGDYIVVINAEKVRLTGHKLQEKHYFSHSGYPGGGKLTPANQMLERHPERVIEYAVRRMLPKNALGRSMFRKLKVYAGEQHPHQAQQPEKLEFK